MKKEVTTENQDARIEEGAETVALGGPLHVEYILAVLPSLSKLSLTSETQTVLAEMLSELLDRKNKLVVVTDDLRAKRTEQLFDFVSQSVKNWQKSAVLPPSEEASEEAIDRPSKVNDSRTKNMDAVSPSAASEENNGSINIRALGFAINDHRRVTIFREIDGKFFRAKDEYQNYQEQLKLILKIANDMNDGIKNALKDFVRKELRSLNDYLGVDDIRHMPLVDTEGYIKLAAYILCVVALSKQLTSIGSDYAPINFLLCAVVVVATLNFLTGFNLNLDVAGLLKLARSGLSGFASSDSKNDDVVTDVDDSSSVTLEGLRSCFSALLQQVKGVASSDSKNDDVGTGRMGVLFVAAQSWPIPLALGALLLWATDYIGLLTAGMLATIASLKIVVDRETVQLTNGSN